MNRIAFVSTLALIALVGCSGQDGAAGRDGADGASGEAGAAGPSGSPGATGPKGETGAAADAGSAAAADSAVVTHFYTKTVNVALADIPASFPGVQLLCPAGERFVAGGCSANVALLGSEPLSGAGGDVVGWTCRGERDPSPAVISVTVTLACEQ